jgi:CTP:molybdopterin cytidylyltransferase MocA
MTAAGLLLAAGEGRRFGRPKALVSYRGELLADRAVRMLRDAGCDPVVVVLGAAAKEVAASADLAGAVVIVNDGWSEGIGASLRTGLNALTGLRAPAAVVALVDQPAVSAAAVGRLVDAWEAGALAAVASYDDRPGNPVLLDASVWPEVCALAHGDVGARAWLRAQPERVFHVRCDDVASPIDIDVPDDLERLGETRQ